MRYRYLREAWGRHFILPRNFPGELSFQDNESVGKINGFIDLVSNKHNRPFFFLPNTNDFLFHEHSRLSIQLPEGFIEQQDDGFIGIGPRFHPIRHIFSDGPPCQAR